MTNQVELETGRAACLRRDRPPAFAALTAAEQIGRLEPEDLELLGEAAFWTGHHDASIAARQNAFRAYEAQGNSRRAGFVAVLLTFGHLTRQAFAVAGGWFQAATRLLADEPDCSEVGWSRWLDALFIAFVERDSSKAVALAKDLHELGRELGDADLQALALGTEAALLVHAGTVHEGLTQLDASMTLSIAGEVTPFVAGLTYCSTLSTCNALGDYPRATEWGVELDRMSGAGALSELPGDWCLHRAELLRLHGEWTEAEAETTRACAELENYDLAHVALGLYELGEISRHRGDLGAAEEAFARSADLGRDPNPGRAELWLAEGDVSRAAAEIETALAAAPDDRLLRAQLLPAVVTIARQGNQIDLASERAGELEALRDVYGSIALQARASAARGAVELARGDATTAVVSLRSAVRSWRAAGVPHETATTQVLLGRALQANGDREAARRELEHALAEFDRLGAVNDRQHAADLLGIATPRVRVVRTFMFTDIEDSTSLLAGMGDDEWSNVLESHDRLLRGCFLEQRGEEIKQRGGGDGFFVVFESPTAAARCAISIQRQLSEQRRTHGFAPRVRIGFHEAEALAAHGDYSGRGVHEAARIAALAEGEEITTSRTTADATEADVTHDHVRTVNLRGLPGEVDVVSVVWSR